MTNVRVVASACVAAIVVVFLYYSKWKKKKEDPPDKESTKQKPEDKSSRSSSSHCNSLGKAHANLNRNSNSNSKSEDLRENLIDDGHSQNQVNHIDLQVGKSNSAAEGKASNTTKDTPVKPKDGSGDNNAEEGPIVNESFTAVETKHTESAAPSVPLSGNLPEVKKSGVSSSQVVVAEVNNDQRSSEQEVAIEETIAPTKSQGVYASSESSSLPASEQTKDKSLSVAEQILQNSLPITEQSVENNLEDNSSAQPSNDSTKTASNESTTVVQNTSNSFECVDKDLTCKTSDNSMSRSWHEEVEDQCDKDMKVSDNKSAVENCNKSPVPDLMKNGVPEVGMSEERLTKSPSRTEQLKADDAQTSSDASSNCDNLSEASNDSGKGGSVNDNSQQSSNDEERVYEFNIPSDICGLFIGTRGKTIKTIRDQSGARIRLRNNPYTPDFQICVIEGAQSAIERALSIIKRKFPSIKYPGMDLTPLAQAPVIMPEIMQLGLPEGVSVDIVVSSIVDAGRVFVQQPTHPSFPSLERLNAFMNQCYLQDGAVPDIPRPIESGVICAAPMLNGWYRAQIMTYYENTDDCDIKYVDYGGYSHISSQCLKQIRSDFMTLPFEAVECYLGNVTSLENESFFSAEAAVVLEELTQGKLLQAQVVGRAEDGIPYVHIYQINGNSSALLVNREMVNRGVVRWTEQIS